MALTDDELKRLKWISENTDHLKPRVHVLHLQGIIARLEAAEKCMLDHINLTGDLQANLEAWRKSKGEE